MHNAIVLAMNMAVSIAILSSDEQGGTHQCRQHRWHPNLLEGRLPLHLRSQVEII